MRRSVRFEFSIRVCIETMDPTTPPRNTETLTEGLEYCCHASLLLEREQAHHSRTLEQLASTKSQLAAAVAIIAATNTNQRELREENQQLALTLRHLVRGKPLSVPPSDANVRRPRGLKLFMRKIAQQVCGNRQQRLKVVNMAELSE